MEKPLIKLKNRIINLERATSVTQDQNGTVHVDFQTGGGMLVREIFTGMEGARLWAYLSSVVHELKLEEK